MKTGRFVGRPHKYLQHLLEGDGYYAGLPPRYRDGSGLITARDWMYYSVWYKVSVKD